MMYKTDNRNVIWCYECRSFQSSETKTEYNWEEGGGYSGNFHKRVRGTKTYNFCGACQGERITTIFQEFLRNCKDFGLNIREIEKWIELDLKPNEHELVNYLVQKGCETATPNIQAIITKESWRDIHKNFDYLLRKGWEDRGFNKEQAKEWISVGARADDYKFIVWLKTTKNETPRWITNYKEDYQILSERFKKYGLCKECNQPNTGEKWCRDCNVKHILPALASNNPEINEFIQKYQLAATEVNKFIEWIPYEQFTDVEYLAKGGFGKVYKAKWAEGNISHWDATSKKWQREKDEDEGSNQWTKKTKDHREVVLKSLNNSQVSIDFLQETEKHKIIDDWFNNIVPCYGLSQNPETGNYLMVMQYMPQGNLRNYLSNKNRELSLKDKFKQLLRIAQGLKDIHQKNLVHRDFHSGNILKGIEKTSCLITDLGLCKPVNEASQEKKIYGVLPYVAPEIFCEKPYTQKADIYSFGIIACEVLTGLPPYYYRTHDFKLALEVWLEELRPEFQIKIPSLLEQLIKQCWTDSPQDRPTANELERTLRNWEKDIEFQNQLQAAEEYNKTLPEEIKYPKYKIHSGAIYHSKLLPTKEITKLIEKFGINLSSADESKELVKNFIHAYKKMLKDKNNKEAKNEVKKLDKELEKNLSKENLKKIIEYCKTSISLEQWQVEQNEQQLKAQIQQVDFPPFSKNS